MLVDFQSYFAHKDEIYAELWEYYHVDSLHAYGDYDESAMFAYATALVVESFYRFYLSEKDKVSSMQTNGKQDLPHLYTASLPQIASILLLMQRVLVAV